MVGVIPKYLCKYHFLILELPTTCNVSNEINRPGEILNAAFTDIESKTMLSNFIEANGNQYAYAETFMVPARMEQIDFKNISDREVVLLIGRMKNGWSL